MSIDSFSIETIPTPSVIIDLPTAQRNIEKMSRYCREHNLKLRPHTKTHKSIYMARLQMEAGASGLTVAKVGEARAMAEAGDDLLIAYPALDRNRSSQIAEMAKAKAIHVGIDSTTAADHLAEAARAAGSTIGILVDVDT